MKEEQIQRLARALENHVRIFNLHVEADKKAFNKINETLSGLATREDANQIIDIVRGLNVSGKAVMWLGGLATTIIGLLVAWRSLGIK